MIVLECFPSREAFRNKIEMMKTYKKPITTEEKICNLFAICEPSPGNSKITQGAGEPSGGGTEMAPGKKVF